MKNRILNLHIIVLFVVAQTAFSQVEIAPSPLNNPNAKVNAENEISPELKKSAAEFLRNTSVEVNNMRTLENRISFSSEIASLMWFNDEREARAMYSNVINSFRQLIAQYEGQMNSFTGLPGDLGDSAFENTEYISIARKFGRAMGVRQQIATSLAEHDPRLALEFFTDSLLAISNQEMRERTERQDAYFETQLLQQIAENDVETAFKYAQKSVAKSLTYDSINLLRKIYEKNPEKGILLGEDFISKIKRDSSEFEWLHLVSQLLDFGEESGADKIDKKSGKVKRPVFSNQQLREIAEVLAKGILAREDPMDFETYVLQIEKYLPARALQIRRKFGIKKSQSTAAIKTESDLPMPNPSVETNEKKNAQAQLMENMGALGDKELNEEQRQKVVEQSRAIIDSIGDRNQKLMAMSALALQVANLGDKKLATELLDSASRLVKFQPVNYRDYMEAWMLVSGYAQVDSEKAFPMIESAIYRINDTIASFVKVAEFMDIEGDMIDEGEVQLGSFGGGLTRGIVNELGIANDTIRKLAIADFKRTKDLTNRFDRQEIRILAKMLVLRAVLGKDRQTSAEIEGPGF